jgi:hypothetical protein
VSKQDKYDAKKAAAEKAEAKDRAAKEALIKKQTSHSPGKMTRPERQLTKRIAPCDNCNGEGCKKCKGLGSR